MQNKFIALQNYLIKRALIPIYIGDGYDLNFERTITVTERKIADKVRFIDFHYAEWYSFRRKFPFYKNCLFENNLQRVRVHFQNLCIYTSTRVWSLKARKFYLPPVI